MYAMLRSYWKLQQRPFCNNISWLNDAIEWSNQTVELVILVSWISKQYRIHTWNVITFSSSLLSCQMVFVGGTFWNPKRDCKCATDCWVLHCCEMNDCVYKNRFVSSRWYPVKITKARHGVIFLSSSTSSLSVKDYNGKNSDLVGFYLEQMKD